MDGLIDPSYKKVNIMEFVSCNLCGSTDYSVIYQIPDLLLENDDDLFTLVGCDRCGLVYQNPRPTEEEIGRYYPQDYEPFYQDGNKNWLLRKVNLRGVEKRRRIVTSLNKKQKGGRLLDIGCSTGLFLNELRRTGLWEVWGNDTSEYAVKIAKDQYQLEVFQGSVIQANYPTVFFDVVTLWDVLEHLPDPAVTLREISRITKPESYLILRLPNYDSFDSKLFGQAWAGLDVPRHYYVFSKRNIERLLDTNGFTVKNINGDIGVYPTFVLSLRFWLTSHSVHNSVGKKIIRLLNHPILKLFFAPFFYFYGLFLLGSEITVVAQKK
jgi:SAM-dependent methyltransferase